MPNKVNMDIISKNGGSGDIASYMINTGRLDPAVLRPWINPADGKAYITSYNGGDPKDIKSYAPKLVANATLRRDEWVQLDNAILPIARTRLRGIADLQSRGLTYNLGNALGTTVLEHHTMGDAFEAELTMDGLTRGKNDNIEFETVYTPIPILHVDYQLNLRHLESSRKLGNPLDTSQAELAARKIAEKMESMLFTNETYSFSSNSGAIYSYINHPNRGKRALIANWDESGADPKQDVLNLKQDMLDKNMYGPWVLYTPANFETTLDDDYSDKHNITVRQRLLQIDGITEIKTIDTLPDDNVVLVQMTSDVVRLINGMPIQNVQWKEEGNFITKFKVMAIQVPQIRADQLGNCGVVHGAVGL